MMKKKVYDGISVAVAFMIGFFIGHIVTIWTLSFPL
jgi:hypothetical protein